MKFYIDIFPFIVYEDRYGTGFKYIFEETALTRPPFFTHIRKKNGKHERVQK